MKKLTAATKDVVISLQQFFCLILFLFLGQSSDKFLLNNIGFRMNTAITIHI